MLVQKHLGRSLAGHVVIPTIDRYASKYNSMKAFAEALAIGEATVSTSTVTSIKKGLPVPQKINTVIAALEEKHDFDQASETLEAQVVISTNMTAARQSSGYSRISDLAEALSVATQVVSWMEQGKPVSRDLAERTLRLLGLADSNGSLSSNSTVADT